MTIHRFALLSAAIAAFAFSTSTRASTITNGGFEAGTAVTNPDNATAWDWTPNNNGERVNALTDSAGNNGDGTVGAHLIDPLFGSWFGYAENGAGAQLSGEVAQANVVIDTNTPVLEFWWRFFTNETPGVENTFNDRFRVSVEGSTTVTAVVADVNSTTMTTSGGPLWSPTPGGPGQNQQFGNYTGAWGYYGLNVSALAGETVTIYFRVNDVGASHNQSSGFALDNVQFVTPEPGTFVLAGLGVLGLVGLSRRRIKK